MGVIYVRVNSKEKKMIKNFLKTKGLTASQYIKKMLFEQMENEYDLKVVKDYLKAKEEGTLDFIPFEEAVKEWNID